MNSALKRITALIACLVVGALAVSRQTESSAANTWDQKAAAAYLDQRANWWMEWPKSARDHETFCVSCHTAVPYALSRSALRKPLAEAAPSANERRLLDNVTKRVRLWKEVEPFYSDAARGAYKTVESRGTESVLNALILASNDAQRGQLSKDTLTALENMWSEQQTTGDKKGAWLWLRFANEPWEADDSDFYGATLAAIAVGTAPGNYRSKPEIQNNLKLLGEYLNSECAAQTTINRAVLLWASAKMPGLLGSDKQKTIITELLDKQQPDGGWSLSGLSGEWKRHDGTPQEAKSDGYATGLIALALQRAGTDKENVQEKRALAWLAANQSKAEGNWSSSSLNNNKEHHLSPETALFMNDAATAYAILALTEAHRQ
jgi:squalene-hopene/tetraprenyl-beta-curcumene cyclase